MDDRFRWPSNRCAAVSLTYDGLPVHTMLVAPVLAQHGTRATFYVPTLSDIGVHPKRSRQLAAAGHELGNHTIFHPCRREPADRFGWLDPSFDLATYSAVRLRAELEAANVALTLVDGQTRRTFGNTCCDTTIGQGAAEQAMAPILADFFAAARGAQTDRPAVPSPALDLFDVGCFGVGGLDLAELQAIVADAQSRRGWAVLMIHGVGADRHTMHLEPDIHEQFIAWLVRETGVWTAPFLEVATSIQQQRIAG